MNKINLNHCFECQFLIRTKKYFSCGKWENEKDFFNLHIGHNLFSVLEKDKYSNIGYGNFIYKKYYQKEVNYE